MNRLLITTIIKFCGEAVLIAIVAGFGIGIFGYLKKWDSSLAYGNAFFIAGALIIIAGAASRMGASQERNMYQMFHIDTFRNMSASEQANYVIELSSSVHLAILGILSGILLILASWFVTKIF